MSIKLYYNDMSPQVRAVLMTAKALSLDLELLEVNIYGKEDQQDADLLKVNPQHTVPTLVDGDLIIWDSHAIAGYLVATASEKGALYPNEPKKRSIVDQFLFFDSGVLQPRVDTILNSIIVENEKEISAKKISAITESYKFLDKCLENRNYLNGESLTVADLCCVTTISTATIITPISTERYPNLSNWYKTCKNIANYDETNGIGLNKLDALVEFKLGRPRTKDFCE